VSTLPAAGVPGDATGDPAALEGMALDELIAGLAVDVPDFPEPGVLFRDLTPVFAHGEAFRRMVDGLATPTLSDPRAAAVVDPPGGPGTERGFDVVVGVEARGFLLAAAVALQLGIGVVPVRKAGKLPRERVAADYNLEYGTATLELHLDSIRPGQRVLLVDDVLATGGTLAAAVALVEQLGGVVGAVSVVIELSDLGGRQRIAPHAVHSLWIT
jgi:adenine phosphoribosyltransferase